MDFDLFGLSGPLLLCTTDKKLFSVRMKRPQWRSLDIFSGVARVRPEIILGLHINLNMI